LRDSEQHFRILVDHVLAAVYALDLNAVSGCAGSEAPFAWCGPPEVSHQLAPGCGEETPLRPAG
jgi:hypothetical protein